MKKNKLGIFSVIFISIFLWNCNGEKYNSVNKFEKTVFYEVFPDLLDSIYHDYRLVKPPPPYFKLSHPYTQEKFDKKIDSLKEHSPIYKKMLSDWKVRKDSISKQKSYVVIYDSINNYDKNYEIERSLKIDLQELECKNDMIEFKYHSEFKGNEKFWRKTRNYDFHVVALINFRNIKFNENKDSATFDCGYSMGHLNGIGYLITIKKGKDGKWKVEKIEGTSIS